MKVREILVLDDKGQVVMRGFIQDFRLFVDNCFGTNYFEVKGIVKKEDDSQTIVKNNESFPAHPL